MRLGLQRSRVLGRGVRVLASGGAGVRGVQFVRRGGAGEIYLCQVGQHLLESVSGGGIDRSGVVTQLGGEAAGLGSLPDAVPAEVGKLHSQ